MSNIKIGQFPSTRLRRLRMKDFSRRMISENNLSVNDLIWPIFVCEGNNIADEIKSMPGVFRYSIDSILKELETIVNLKIPAIALFPQIDNSLKEGVTATDVVLTLTERLRSYGVVGKFVEFFGKGLKNLTLADRATISNMAPEYGATCGYFPTDQETINYLKLSGKDDHHLKVVETYSSMTSPTDNKLISKIEFLINS